MSRVEEPGSGVEVDGDGVGDGFGIHPRDLEVVSNPPLKLTAKAPEKMSFPKRNVI